MHAARVLDDATVGKCTCSLSRVSRPSLIYGRPAPISKPGAKRVAFYSDKHAVSRVNNLCHPSPTRLGDGDVSKRQK
jgi:hypothetical protein